MQQQGSPLSAAQSGDVCFGFQLVKKEYIASKSADLYTLRHEKTGAELLYFDRADENKTFSVGFKTLPENDTGVFHILEHTVLNGSSEGEKSFFQRSAYRSCTGSGAYASAEAFLCPLEYL